MLERDAEGLLEIAQDVQGRIGILYIIVGQFLPLDLLREGQGEGRRFQGRVEVGGLVRILAVAERLPEVIFQEELLRQPGLRPHVRGDAGVVFRRMGIGLGGEFEPRLRGGRAVFAEFGEDGPIVGGIADDGHVAPVLGGAPDHRRPADVDVFYGLFQGDALLRDGLPERIQVHADEVDGFDAVLGEGLHVGGQFPAGEDAPVDLRVQGLHTAVEDLREAGDFADSDGFHTLPLEELLRPARGDDFPAEGDEPADEIHESGLVAYTD